MFFDFAIDFRRFCSIRLQITYFRAERIQFSCKPHSSRAESPKELSSGQSVSVAPSEAIPHYFRTVRAKALNMADFGKPNRRFV